MSAYQHTLADIRGEVRNLLLQSSSNTNWTDEQLNTCINRALDDARLADVCEIATGAFHGVSGQQEQNMPSEVWKVLAITYDDEILKEITRADMDALTGGDYDASSGTPQYWYADRTQDGTVIKFDKTFSESGKTVRYWYWRRAQDLSDDAELSTLYKVMSNVIIYRALQLAHLADENVQAAQAWHGEYLAALQDARLHMEQLHLSEVPLQHDPYGWGGALT